MKTVGFSEYPHLSFLEYNQNSFKRLPTSCEKGRKDSPNKFIDLINIECHVALGYSRENFLPKLTIEGQAKQIKINRYQINCELS